MKSGYERIKDERSRQIAVEGMAAAHDDGYIEGELKDAADCYDLHARIWCNDGKPPEGIPEGWPKAWEASWWKPGPGPARCWEKAGALFLAEAARCRRAGSYLAVDMWTTRALECAIAIDRRATVEVQEVVNEALWQFAEAQRSGPFDTTFLHPTLGEMDLNEKAVNAAIGKIMAAFGREAEIY